MSSKDLLQEPRTIVQLVAIDESGDSYYRMRWPGRGLAAAAPQWRVISLDSNAIERFEWSEKADLLILFQSADPDLLPIIQRRRLAGKKTLVEYNDNFYDPPVASPAYEYWSSPLNWACYERGMNAADGLIVTGPGLKELFSKKTKTPIFEIKNQMPENDLMDFEKLWAAHGDEIRMGWGGSMGHMPDLFAFLPALREVMAALPNVKLHIMGNDSIPNYLDIPQDRFRFYHWGSMRQYFQFLESFHIGFVPLLDTPYNRCRSDIKAVEMGSRGVLPLLPNLLPYAEFLKKTDLKPYTSFSDFKESLKSMIQDLSKMKSEAKKAYDYVRDHRLSRQNQERLELCLSMMTAKPEDFRPDIPPGYHEIRGTPGAQPLFKESLLQVQNIFNNRRRSDALIMLEELVKSNPLNPEFAISHLKSLKVVGFHALREKCQAYAKNFPEDLRFKLFEIDAVSSFEERLPVWKNIFDILTQMPDLAKKSYRTLTINAVVKELQDNREFLERAKDFYALYPGSIALALEMAKAYEFRSEKFHSVGEWKRVLAAVEDFYENKDALASLNLMELRTWVQALSNESK